MLSQDYLDNFEQTLGQVKTAAGANKFIGMFRPFSNKGKFDEFAKQLGKDQPWMRQAGVGATDMLRSIQNSHPFKSLASRISGYNKKGIKSYGDTFKKDFMNKYPDQFEAAQKGLQRNKLLKGTAIGAGGLLAGQHLLKKKQPEQDYSWVQ